MEFLLLLLTNIFIGAVLYLVISLKLEKKSTEYREKKFRQEMDDVMREFNSAADRNISLLENKIEILKRLLERSGKLKSVDFTVGGLNKINDSSTNEVKKDTKNIGPVDQQNLIAKEKIIPNNIIIKGFNLKKSLLILINKIFSKYIKYKGLDIKIATDQDLSVENNQTNDLIELDVHKMESNDSINEDLEQKKDELTEKEIFEIVSSSKDMHSIVTQLFDNGCSIENISKYSGIPVGEIKLVLNLNNSR